MTKYQVTLDFTPPLWDKQSRAVPMNDCRKIYMGGAIWNPRNHVSIQSRNPQ